MGPTIGSEHYKPIVQHSIINHRNYWNRPCGVNLRETSSSSIVVRAKPNVSERVAPNQTHRSRVPRCAISPRWGHKSSFLTDFHFESKSWKDQPFFDPGLSIFFPHGSSWTSKCCISPPLCKCKALIIFTSGPFPLPVDQYCYCHGAMIRFHKNFEKSCCNIFLGCEITWCQRGSGASNSPWVDDNAPVVLSMGRPRTVCWWLGIKGLGRLDLVRICGSLSGLVSRSRPYRALWSPGLFSPSYRRGKPQTTPWSKL